MCTRVYTLVQTSLYAQFFIFDYRCVCVGGGGGSGSNPLGSRVVSLSKQITFEMLTGM